MNARINNNTVDAEIVEGDPRKQIKPFGLISWVIFASAVALWVVGGGINLLLAANLSEWHPAFWAGLLYPTILVIGGLLMWWATHRDEGQQLAGFIVGLTDLVGILLVTIFLVLLPAAVDSAYPFDKFGWGALASIVLAVPATVTWLYGMFNRKFKPVVKTSANPS